MLRKRKADEAKVVEQPGYKKPDWAKRLDYYRIIADNTGEPEKEYRNPRSHLHGIVHPWRAIIAGMTGTGKTQLCCDLIRVCDNFDEVYVFTLFGEDDPIWGKLGLLFPDKKVTVTDNIGDIPDGEELIKEDDGKTQRLFIADDVQAAPNPVQKKIAHRFYTFRKCNGSVAYLAQSYFGCPKLCRDQASLVFLLQDMTANNIQNFKALAARYGDSNTIARMYAHCGKLNSGKDKSNFFWINCTGDELGRFRCGFDQTLQVEDFNTKK